MKPLSQYNQARVGAVTLVLIALCAVAAFYAKDLPIIGGGTTFTAKFAESAGLRSGNEVRLAGVKVGEVTAVELDGAQVSVDFRVSDMRMGDQSRLSIEIKTLLGDKYLAVESTGAGEQNPNEPIPKARTVTPFDIVDAFSETSRLVGEVDTEQLAGSFRTLSETFENTPGEMSNAFNGLSALSRTISARDKELATLLRNASSVSEIVADRDEQLRAIITNGGELLGELERRREAVGRLLTGTRELAEQLSGLVADSQRELQPALRQLEQVTAVLERNQQNLSNGIRDLAPFARLFNNVVGNGRWFEGYICGLIPPRVSTGILDINPEGCDGARPPERGNN
ncbi:phospholipid/cholesterol/gamma-HCH transport system substrate-binding protein [Tamaricihabitans halophyticus]|uniref:Phospholipid/cholesterol/gamma-HCH transport system substrate-binding protein n=1 Tax=Tamaricihabitans halophyticus TaxID=1262583 RepID=A0A4R2Q9X7_9PSEU|nr:MCE family protein [Tamaricihabitans halophyticus]TCP45389.1 phospholipid/cholesterol/gamma-HCH transport system substrate-binding protein [Tamaricihabitans halophyticus]